LRQRLRSVTADPPLVNIGDFIPEALHDEIGAGTCMTDLTEYVTNAVAYCDAHSLKLEPTAVRVVIDMMDKWQALHKVNVLDHIPAELHQSIRDRTCTTNLLPFIQQAIDSTKAPPRIAAIDTSSWADVIRDWLGGVIGYDDMPDREAIEELVAKLVAASGPES
jgi:hypothetical protein